MIQSWFIQIAFFFCLFRDDSNFLYPKQISLWITLFGSWFGSILFSAVSVCVPERVYINELRIFDSNIYYFSRKHPKLMLCLQNGRFDHPDRMFNKMSDVYSNCLNNMSDFKVSLFERLV